VNDQISRARDDQISRALTTNLPRLRRRLVAGNRSPPPPNRTFLGARLPHLTSTRLRENIGVQSPHISGDSSEDRLGALFKERVVVGHHFIVARALEAI
jgi:hypothetical protein